MDLLIWGHTYSIGNDLVDNQHKKLMELINTLHRIESGESDEDINDVLNELVNYTVYHFKSEEELQQKHNYPGYEAHKEIHKQLVSEVSKNLELLRTGDEAIKEKLMIFLTDWLKDHILGEDKKLGLYLQQQKSDEEEDDL